MDREGVLQYFAYLVLVPLKSSFIPVKYINSNFPTLQSQEKIEKRYFEGVLDDKKFQGELFGICNLLRDLSDKLFTSEIIEMHGEHGKSNKAEATGIREIVDTDLFCSEEKRKPSTESVDADNQNLVEFGIVYSHRNEDVVNMRTTERNVHAIDETVETSSVELQSKQAAKHIVKAKAYSVEQKRTEFRRIASFMGMGEVEFSKWLLSVSPVQRYEVLQNYKRKMKRKCNRT